MHIKFCVEVDSFVLDPSLKLPPSTTQLVLQVNLSLIYTLISILAQYLSVLQMCELGWLYNKVSKYIKYRGGLSGGCMGQALCASLEDDLLDYFRLIAVLEAQLNQNRTSLTLRRLVVWSQDPLERLRVINSSHVVPN